MYRGLTPTAKDFRPFGADKLKLDELTSEALGRAIEIYLRLAYAGGEPSEVVRGRAAIPAGRRGKELVDDPRFEKVPVRTEVESLNPSPGPAGHPLPRERGEEEATPSPYPLPSRERDEEAAERYNLRLGNAGYLNMKLGVCRVAATEDYVLRVDTHDRQFAAMVQERENAEYRALLERNRRLQNEIERAWSEAGLPTFERYLREQLEKEKGKSKKVKVKKENKMDLLTFAFYLLPFTFGSSIL